MGDVTSNAAAGRRRRGLALERAIFDAVWELLDEVGYEQLTMGAIAARAGTSKPVLYRRWANKAELVFTALRARVPAPAFSSADHGSLRNDLVAMLRVLADRFASGPPEVVRTVRAAMVTDPELQAVQQRHLSLIDIRIAMSQILERAAARGEVSGEPVGDRVLMLPLQLMRQEGVRAVPVSDKAVLEIVDQILVPLLSAL